MGMFLIQKTDQKLVEQAKRILLRMLRGLKEASGDPAQAELAEKYQARMQRLGAKLYELHVRVQVGCSYRIRYTSGLLSSHSSMQKCTHH